MATFLAVGCVHFISGRRCSPCWSLLTALVLVAAGLSPLSAWAQASVETDAGVFLLEEQELQTAAAECGIGIAGERFEPVAAAALPDPVIGLGKWISGLVTGHIRGVITRRLGMDEQYNRHLAVSRQLRQIEGQLRALDERFDQLGDQIRIKEFRQLSGNLAERFVNPVKNGLDSLETLHCEEAALLNAERMGRDTARAKLDRDRARAAFGRSCQRTAFEDIPRDLSVHLKSSESILDRYLDAVILPRRYLTREDSVAFDDFFHRYHLVQIQALQLTAECELQFPPEGMSSDDQILRDSVADNVYRKTSSHYHRAQIAELPNILPDWLVPSVVLDWDTRLLWWNGTEFGAHPFVNERHLIQDATIPLSKEVWGPNGPSDFRLASLADIEKLAPLDSAMPLARMRSNGPARYPATLAEFLTEIGLSRVVEKIGDTPQLGFIWTSDVGKPIRRCHTRGGRGCSRWYDPHQALGHTAVTASARTASIRAPSGHVWRAPEQCLPGQCFDFWNENPRVVSLCKDPKHHDGLNRCIADAVLGRWQLPGIYRAPPMSNDQYFAVDLSAVRQ